MKFQAALLQMFFFWVMLQILTLEHLKWETLQHASMSLMKGLEAYLNETIMEEETEGRRHRDDRLIQLLQNSPPNNRLHIGAWNLIEVGIQLSFSSPQHQR